MEGQPAAEALKQREAIQLPDTPDVQKHRDALLEAMRQVTEYPKRFERLEAEQSFSEQLEQRNKILQDVGLTTNINGEAIAYPSYEDQRAKLLERPELLTKMNQGFARLQLVPIGAPLSTYFTALEDGLKQYAKKERLRATDGTILNLNEDNPLWKWDEYDEAGRERFGRDFRCGGLPHQSIEAVECFFLVRSEIVTLTVDGHVPRFAVLPEPRFRLTCHEKTLQLGVGKYTRQAEGFAKSRFVAAKRDQFWLSP